MTLKNPVKIGVKGRVNFCFSALLPKLSTLKKIANALDAQVVKKLEPRRLNPTSAAWF